jgi:hypothetical protein
MTCTSLNPNTARRTTHCSVAHLPGPSICDLQDHASAIHNYLDRYVGEVMQTLEDTGTGLSAYTPGLLTVLHGVVVVHRRPGPIASASCAGLRNNTIVIFASDNGPHDEGGHDVYFFQSAGPL